MKTLLALALFLTIPTFAAPVDDVRNAEIAFAKAFADRDAKTFFSFVAEDATFLSPAGTSRGRDAVVKTWSRYFEGPQAPFAWTPERVNISADGRLGLSTGPVFTPDGRHAGDFISTWRRQDDGSWKVVFDSSGPAPAVRAEDAAAVEEGTVRTPDGATLYYRKVGSGRTTVIVPLDYVLHDHFRQLSDLATIITYDPRNRGRSSRVSDAATLTIEQDVADLETVRKHFNADRIVPVGYSYLGKVVAMYGASHPDRVSRIVQLAPAANDAAIMAASRPDEDFGASKAEIERWQQLRAEGASAKSPREFCLAQWNVLRFYLTGDPKSAARFPVAATCALENEWPLHFDTHMKHHLPTILAARLSPEELGKLTMPVLVIHGTADRNAPLAAGQAWRRELPQAKLLTVPRAAHAIWIDDPLVVFAALRSFLRGDWPMGAE